MRDDGGFEIILTANMTIVKIVATTKITCQMELGFTEVRHQHGECVHA